MILLVSNTVAYISHRETILAFLFVLFICFALFCFCFFLFFFIRVGKSIQLEIKLVFLFRNSCIFWNVLWFLRMWQCTVYSSRLPRLKTLVRSGQDHPRSFMIIKDLDKVLNLGANTTALFSSPVASALDSKLDDPGSSPSWGKAFCPWDMWGKKSKLCF